MVTHVAHRQQQQQQSSDTPDVNTLRRVHLDRTLPVPCRRAAGLRPVVKDPCKEGPGEDVGDWPAKEGGSGVGGTGIPFRYHSNVVKCKHFHILVVHILNVHINDVSIRTCCW
jgi:hypothetical protein